MRDIPPIPGYLNALLLGRERECAQRWAGQVRGQGWPFAGHFERPTCCVEHSPILEVREAQTNHVRGYDWIPVRAVLCDVQDQTVGQDRDAFSMDLRPIVLRRMWRGPVLVSMPRICAARHNQNRVR